MRQLKRIDNKKTAILLKAAFQTSGVRQAHLSYQTKLHQSQISRLLKGKFQRSSRGLYALCTYLKVEPVFRDGLISLKGYPDLADCLSEVLDGSRKKERAVIELLKSARRLT